LYFPVEFSRIVENKTVSKRSRIMCRERIRRTTKWKRFYYSR